MHAYTLSIQDDCHTALGQLRLYSKIPSQKQQQKTNTPKNQNQNRLYLLSVLSICAY